MTTKMTKLTTSTTTTTTTTSSSSTNKKEQAEQLKIVVCCRGLGYMDGTQKVFAFYPCNGPSFKICKYSENNCTSNSCIAHFSFSVELRGPPVTKDQKSIFLVFYHAWNDGDEFSYCGRSDPVCGCYTTREAALTALELPLGVLLLLPDRDTDVHSTVEPPVADGELYCREYPVTGW
ncbi:hypothetical protein FRACYDRAFT_269707 [Fragilariopsis cylindrus CCMP1102]|uniref:Uncharacterized protein n=1 Tax=Fragilariopsis cylindrus CCMP1102 TaxID=635003 RepID=A0A1E7F9U6_9STRA|nr:hypothetical protein FRACYDRAFT_269707 [Fragilariopsis cylindrus CCMP1102]|eukprot:OEU14909.1 hypothetical protein FRACYDRAFT_269707 [Fragilariopsis cylindrus CCMP1102]